MVVNLNNKRFGRLVAVKPVSIEGYAGRHRQWLCRCDCGNEVVLTTSTWGRTQSCGCFASEVTRNRSLTHGKTNTKTWKIWMQMRRRCRSRKEYSAISVCERWLEYENFLADMGECPVGMLIDRIDPTGNYEPSNCRWATAREQANNRRNTVFIEHDGKRLSASDWSIKTGIPLSTIKWRYRKGLPSEKILSTAKRPFASLRSSCYKANVSQS